MTVWEWRWRERQGERRGSSLEVETGWLNRRDDEIDDGSSFGTVDEARRGVAVDDIVGEEAPAGWWTEEGVGLSGFARVGV